MKKKIKSVYDIFCFIAFITFVVLFFYINKIGIIPTNYISLFMGIELIVVILSFFLCRKKYIVLNIIGVLFSFILITLNTFSCYYVRHLDKFIDSKFTNEIVNTTTFYIVTSKDNSITDVKDLTLDKNIYYYLNSSSMKKAKKHLGDYEYIEVEDIISFMKEDIKNESFLLIDKINYIFTFENDEELNKDDYNIMYEFDVKTSEERNNEVKDAYNILVMGKDFSDSRNDLNMIITINTNTKKMLITSIPRDYYIDTVGYKYKDSLMYMGLLGDEAVIPSIEAYFDIKIDYKINLYTTNLVDIVDEIGGIEYCSDISYRTTHALVIGTYDDRKGKKFYVKKGCQHLNGIQTLTVARERLAFKTGDRQRQINCRKIMISILNKILDVSTLTNYASILDSFSDFYSTNMNRNSMSILVRTAIKNGGLEVLEQSVDGEGGYGYLAQHTVYSDILIPYKSTVIKATEKINEVLNEK